MAWFLVDPLFQISGFGSCGRIPKFLCLSSFSAVSACPFHAVSCPCLCCFFVIVTQNSYDINMFMNYYFNQRRGEMVTFNHVWFTRVISELLRTG